MSRGARKYFATVGYRSDEVSREVAISAHDYGKLLNARPRGWSAAHLMPKWASRLELPIEDVRVERLQDISEADAIAEGARYFRDLPSDPLDTPSNRWSVPTPRSTRECLSSAQFAFANDFCKQQGIALDFDLWDVKLRAMQFSVTRFSQRKSTDTKCPRQQSKRSSSAWQPAPSKRLTSAASCSPNSNVIPNAARPIHSGSLTPQRLASFASMPTKARSARSTGHGGGSGVCIRRNVRTSR